MSHRRSTWLLGLFVFAALAFSATATAQPSTATPPEPAVADSAVADGGACLLDVPEPIEADPINPCPALGWETKAICMQSDNCPNACEEAGPGGAWCRGHCDWFGCCYCLCE